MSKIKCFMCANSADVCQTTPNTQNCKKCFISRWRLFMDYLEMGVCFCMFLVMVLFLVMLIYDLASGSNYILRYAPWSL